MNTDYEWIDQINVEIVNGVILYNGHDTTYSAIMELDPEFKNIEFSQRMVLATDAMTVLSPTIETEEIWIDNGVGMVVASKTFMYKILRQDGLLIGLVIDPTDTFNGLIFGYVGYDMFDNGLMINEYDLAGLHSYLVHKGDLLENDTLILVDSK